MESDFLNIETGRQVKLSTAIKNGHYSVQYNFTAASVDKFNDYFDEKFRQNPCVVNNSAVDAIKNNSSSKYYCLEREKFVLNSTASNMKCLSAQMKVCSENKNLFDLYMSELEKNHTVVAKVDSDDSKIKGHRKAIPQAVRYAVWDRYCGSRTKGKCYCCNKRITFGTGWHCGHVTPDSKGGSMEIENLRPLCQACNTSMSDTHMEEFVTLYGFKKGRAYKEFNGVRRWFLFCS